MKKYTFLFCMFLSMILAGCTVSKSVVSQGADLTKYKYVTVIDNDTYRMPPELMQYQIQLYDAVEQSGLKNGKSVSSWRFDGRGAVFFIACKIRCRCKAGRNRRNCKFH